MIRVAFRAHPHPIPLPPRERVRPPSPHRGEGRGEGQTTAIAAAFRAPAVKLIAQLGLLLLCLLPIGWQASRQWDTVSQAARQASMGALLASTVALIAASFFLPTAMAAFTRGLARRIGYRDSALAYFLSQPMKYLPGSFWILPGRVLLLQGLGHEAGLASAALLFEMTAQTFSAALVAALLLGLTGFASVWYRGAAWLILAGSLAVCLLLTLAPELLARKLARGSRLGRMLAPLAALPRVMRLRNLLLATLLYVTLWLLMGVSFYFLLVAAAPRLDLALLQQAIGVFALAWLAGFLTPISPGGIGIRESALVLLLAPLLTAPQAIALALLARALALVVELAFCAGAWLWRRLGVKHARTAMDRPCDLNPEI